MIRGFSRWGFVPNSNNKGRGLLDNKEQQQHFVRLICAVGILYVFPQCEKIKINKYIFIMHERFTTTLEILLIFDSNHIALKSCVNFHPFSEVELTSFKAMEWVVSETLPCAVAQTDHDYTTCQYYQNYAVIYAASRVCCLSIWVFIYLFYFGLGLVKAVMLYISFLTM